MRRTSAGGIEGPEERCGSEHRQDSCVAGAAERALVTEMSAMPIERWKEEMRKDDVQCVPLGASSSDARGTGLRGVEELADIDRAMRYRIG